MGYSQSKEQIKSEDQPWSQEKKEFSDFRVDQEQTSENIIILKQPLDEADIDFIMKSIIKLSFVAELSPQIVSQLAQRFHKCTNTNQEWLFQQGSVANYFFLIQSGRVEVVKDGFHARTLNSQDGFGELALLYGIRRSSGIKVPKEWRNKNRYYILNKEDFEKIRETVNFPLSSKFLYLLENHPNFHFFTKREINSIATVANRINFYKNERILTRYDMPHALYIITEGEVRLKYPGGIEIFLGPSDYFGYYGCSFTEYSVISTAETSCYAIGRENLQSILRQNIYSLFLITRLKNILMNCKEIRERFSFVEIAELARQFDFVIMKPFQPICKHKKQVSFIKVPLTCNEESPIIGLSQLISGDRVFIQDYLAQKQGYCAQIQTNQFLKFYNQERKSKKKRKQKYFNDMMFGAVRQYENNPNLTIQLKKQNKFSIKFEVFTALSNNQKAKEKINALSFFLHQVNFNMIRSYYNEEINDETHQINLQFIPGVSIKDVVGQIGPLPLPIARFYLASLILSLEYLHSKRILFRNFAFQSFRIDKFGYLWLYDIMQCQPLDEEREASREIIGDPQWQPPQIINQQNYSFGVDFWGLGILAYVIIMGHFPFGRYEKDSFTIYKDILESPLEFPINCRSKSLKQFVSVLLQKEAGKRNSLEWGKIKKLQFFWGVEWEKLRKKVVDSPYLPNILCTDHL